MNAKYSRFIPNHTPCGHTRREFLWQAGGGSKSDDLDRIDL